MLATRHYVDTLSNKIKDELRGYITTASSHFGSETTPVGEVVCVNNNNSGVKIDADFVEIDTDGKSSLFIDKSGRMYTRKWT